MHGGLIRIRLPSMTLCPGCNQLRIYIFGKKDTIASGECDKKDIFYFGDYLHIDKPKFHRLQKFEKMARRIEIKGSKLTLHLRIAWLIYSSPMGNTLI